MTSKQREIMKKTALFLCVFSGISLALSSCQKDDFSQDGSSVGKAISGRFGGINLDSLRRAGADPRLPNVLPVTLTASYSEEEIRSFGFEIADRPGTDYKGDAYKDEYYPKLRIARDSTFNKTTGKNELKKPTTITVFLTMLKLDASGQPVPNSVHSQPVEFELVGETEDTTIKPDQSTKERPYKDGAPNPKRKPDQTISRFKKNSSGRYSIRYKGTITLPVGYTTFGASSENWYVMGMINGTSPKYGANGSYVGASSFAHTPDQDFDNYLGEKAIPFASNWVKLQISQGGEASMGTNSGDPMIFKPQGILLQMEEGGNLYMDSYDKFNSIVSNVLQFNIRYDFSPQAVVKAFNEKDASGVGLPSYSSEDKGPDFGGFEASNTGLVYGMNDPNYPLSSSEKQFPWDMPGYHNTALAPTKGSYSTLKTLGQSSGEGVHTGTFNRTLEHQKEVWGHEAWLGAVVGGVRYNTRNMVWLWAMPVKNKPASPYTYIYASAYPVGAKASENYQKYWNFDIKAYYALRAEVSEVIANIDALESSIKLYESVINSSATSAADRKYAEAKKKEYSEAKTAYEQSMGSKIQDYKNKQSTLNSLVAGFNSWQKLEGQPAIPLYQTNNAFRASDATSPLSGKVIHFNSFIVADLIFTEVVHREKDGYNYSVIELQNPTRLPISIKDYAIVRLRPGTNGFQFRKKDGALTDKLTEAMILPLEAFREGSTDPLTASGFNSIFSSANVGNFANSNRSEFGVGGSYNPPFSTSGSIDEMEVYTGVNEHKKIKVNRGVPFAITGLADPYVFLPGQTFLIGASGFVKRPIAVKKVVPHFGYIYYETPANAPRDIRTELNNQIRSTPQDYWTFGGMVSYADGGDDNGTNTLDMQAGDGFALIKRTGTGQWQIIDATAPIGEHGYAFAGTFAAYQAEMSGRTSSSNYAMRRNHFVQFPFIFPYKTVRTNPSAWSDDWTIVENSVYGNLGIRDYMAYYNWKTGDYTENKMPISAFHLKRTPWDPDQTWVAKYKAGRPVQK